MEMFNDIKNNLDLQNSLEVRKMTLSDLATIKNILNSDFDDFWSYNVFEEELKNNNSTYIVAILNAEIIGFAGIWKVIDEAHITNIVTKKSYRNRGVGTILLEHLITICKESSELKSLTLEVNEKNTIAQDLYEKFNFQILGKRKKYYNNEQAAIIMTLQL